VKGNLKADMNIGSYTDFTYKKEKYGTKGQRSKAQRLKTMFVEDKDEPIRTSIALTSNKTGPKLETYYKTSQKLVQSAEQKTCHLILVPKDGPQTPAMNIYIYIYYNLKLWREGIKPISKKKQIYD